MKLQCLAILFVFSLFSPTFCVPSPIKIQINNNSAEIGDATTIEVDINPESITTDSSITIPVDPTTLPPEPNNTTTTTLKPTTTAVTTPKPTPPPSPITTTTPVKPTTTSVTTPSTKPTETPSKSTEPPTPLPTPSPHGKGRQFDGPSFIGGIILACGLTAIGFVAFKFYKARTERNYHTFDPPIVSWTQEPRIESCSPTVLLPKTYYMQYPY